VAAGEGGDKRSAENGEPQLRCRRHEASFGDGDAACSRATKIVFKAGLSFRVAWAR
jgi:hypothetical protein